MHISVFRKSVILMGALLSLPVLIPGALAQDENVPLYLTCREAQLSCDLIINESYTPSTVPGLENGQPLLLEFITTGLIGGVRRIQTNPVLSNEGDSIFSLNSNQSLLMAIGLGDLSASSSFTLPSQTRIIKYALLGDGPEGNNNLVFTFQPQDIDNPELVISGVRLYYRIQTGETFRIRIQNSSSGQTYTVRELQEPARPPLVEEEPIHGAPPSGGGGQPMVIISGGGAGRIAVNPSLGGDLPISRGDAARSGLIGGVSGGGGGGFSGGIARSQPGATPVGLECFPDINRIPLSQQRAICELKGKVIDGKPRADGSRYFDPTAFLNRAEVAKIVAYADINIETGAFVSRESEIVSAFQKFYPGYSSPQVSAKPTSFTDVARGQWYAPSVHWLSQQGIVSGYGGTKLYGPSNRLQRVELEKISQLYFAEVVLSNNPNNFIRVYHKDFGIKEPWWAPYAGFTQDFLNHTEMAGLPPERSVSRAAFTEYFHELLKLVKTSE